MTMHEMPQFLTPSRQETPSRQGLYGDCIEDRLCRQIIDAAIEVHKVLGHKFCISGGIPNFLLAYRTPREVRDCCKKVIDGVARDGGYIMDAAAIVQNDAKVENIKAMTDFTREYGVY